MAIFYDGKRAVDIETRIWDKVAQKYDPPGYVDLFEDAPKMEDYDGPNGENVYKVDDVQWLLWQVEDWVKAIGDFDPEAGDPDMTTEKYLERYENTAFVTDTEVHRVED